MTSCVPCRVMSGRVLTVLTALAVVAASLVLVAAEAEATEGECFNDLSGDVVGGAGEPVADTDAERADIVDYCVDFGTDRAVFSVRLSDEADPREDPAWFGTHHLIWSVVTTGDQLADDLVVNDEPVPYAVRFFPDGPAGDELGTVLEEPGPGGGERICDGEASYEEGWLVSTFPLGPGSACFSGEAQLAVSLGTSFDTDDDEVRMDRAPDEEGHYRGFVLRGDAGAGGDATACRGHDVPEAGFTDVDPAQVHAGRIDCIVWYGITQGINLDQYGPAGRVTRAQMASFITRSMTAADYTLPAPSDQGFTDVAGNTHEAAINQLAAAGVVQGTTADTYSPGRPVNRAQMASFLVRAYETMQGPLPGGSSEFTDTAGNTHEDNIDKAAEAGFTTGVTPTSYAPRNPVRRDQMGSFLTRVLERLAADGRLTPLPDQGGLTNASRLHPLGVGPAHAGMTLHEVEDATGTSVEVTGFDTFGGHCYHAQPRGVSAYSFMVLAPGDQPPADPRDGVVARVSTNRFAHPPALTEAGVRPGDTRAAVEAAYGAEQLTESPHAYQPGGVYLDYHTPDGAHGLRFELGADDVVQTIHGGDAEAITFVEGCA